jgi:hypothetical protein
MHATPNPPKRSLTTAFWRFAACDAQVGKPFRRFCRVLFNRCGTWPLAAGTGVWGTETSIQETVTHALARYGACHEQAGGLSKTFMGSVHIRCVIQVDGSIVCADSDFAEAVLESYKHKTADNSERGRALSGVDIIGLAAQSAPSRGVVGRWGLGDGRFTAC